MYNTKKEEKKNNEYKKDHRLRQQPLVRIRMVPVVLRHVTRMVPGIEVRRYRQIWFHVPRHLRRTGQTVGLRAAQIALRTGTGTLVSVV